MMMAIAPLTLGQTITCPESNRSVMIDGRFESNEWNDAAQLKVNDSLFLYFKQDKENVYWCLRGLYKKPVLGGVDFYATDGQQLINLHASAQLGERAMKPEGYGDYVWWNNAGWVANIARIDNLAERKFHMDEAKEFQARKHRFREKNIRIMFQVSSPKHLAAKFPQAAEPTASSGWLLLLL